MIDALGWALVHFLWQGFAFALLFAVVTSPRLVARASTRHTLGVAVLFISALAPLITFSLRLAEAPPASVAPALIGARPGATFWLGAGVDAVLPWVVGLWAVGVGLLSARLVLGWFGCRRLAGRLTIPVEAQLDAVVASLAERLALSRPVRVLASARVSVPTVIGWLRPVVLLPAGAAARMSVEQLEMVLAHEFAHVRRCDWLVNLAQRVIETLLFYHPAVRWMSRRIREERELACDDVAVGLTGRPVAYARVLADLEGLRDTDPGLALAATGGDLRHRVERIVGQDTQRADGAFVHFTVLATLTAALTFGAADMAPRGEGLRETARACPASRARERAIGARAHSALGGAREADDATTEGGETPWLADITGTNDTTDLSDITDITDITNITDMVGPLANGVGLAADTEEGTASEPAESPRIEEASETTTAIAANPAAAPMRPDTDRRGTVSLAAAAPKPVLPAVDDQGPIESIEAPEAFALETPEAPEPGRLLASLRQAPADESLPSEGAPSTFAWLSGEEEREAEEEFTIVATRMVAPEYPFRARLRGEEGFVKLAFSVDPQGHVSNVEVVDAYPRFVFDREASDALRKWRFEVDERLTENLRMVQTFDFKLEDAEDIALVERRRCRGSVSRAACNTRSRSSGIAYVSPPRRIIARGTVVHRQN